MRTWNYWKTGYYYVYFAFIVWTTKKKTRVDIKYFVNKFTEIYMYPYQICGEEAGAGGRGVKKY